MAQLAADVDFRLQDNIFGQCRASQPPCLQLDTLYLLAESWRREPKACLSELLLI